MNIKIDTSSALAAEISVDQKNVSLNRGVNSSQVLLPGLANLVQDAGGWSKITEVSLNTGPGSYTGLRVGASVAQAISWYLQIPLNGSVINDKNPFTLLNYSIDNLKPQL
jgi:tRNA threonylcarbamoyladenosine biosynthesis protein TsaB